MKGNDMDYIDASEEQRRNVWIAAKAMKHAYGDGPGFTFTVETEALFEALKAPTARPPNDEDIARIYGAAHGRESGPNGRHQNGMNAVYAHALRMAARLTRGDIPFDGTKYSDKFEEWAEELEAR